MPDSKRLRQGPRGNGESATVLVGELLVNSETIELRELGRVFRGRKPMLLLVVAAFVGLGYVASTYQVVTYTAQARLVLEQDGVIATNARSIERSIANEIALGTSDAVQQAAAASLGPELVAEVVDISIVAIPDSDILLIEATANTAEAAAGAANAHAAAFEADRRNQRIDRTADAVNSLLNRVIELENASSESTVEQALIDEQLSEATQTILELQRSAAGSTATARVFQEATEPSSSSATSTRVFLIVGAALGAAVGIVSFVGRSATNLRITSVDDIAPLTTVPVLGTIPIANRGLRRTDARRAVLEHPESPTAGAYRTLNAAVNLVLRPSPRPVVLIATPTPTCDTTTVAENLAWVATRHQSTTLIDLDYLGIGSTGRTESSRGITDLAFGAEPHEVERTLIHGEQFLTCVPVGSSYGQHLSTQALTDALTTISQRSDYVVIDGGTLSGDSLSIGQAFMSDATILVIEAGETTKQDLRGALRELEHRGALVGGIVLTEVGPSGIRKRRSRSKKNDRTTNTRLGPKDNDRELAIVPRTVIFTP